MIKLIAIRAAIAVWVRSIRISDRLRPAAWKALTCASVLTLAVSCWVVIKSLQTENENAALETSRDRTYSYSGLAFSPAMPFDPDFSWVGTDSAGFTRHTYLLFISDMSGSSSKVNLADLKLRTYSSIAGLSPEDTVFLIDNGEKRLIPPGTSVFFPTYMAGSNGQYLSWKTANVASEGAHWGLLPIQERFDLSGYCASPFLHTVDFNGSRTNDEIAYLIDAAKAGESNVAIVGSEVLLRSDVTESREISPNSSNRWVTFSLASNGSTTINSSQTLSISPQTFSILFGNRGLQPTAYGYLHLSDRVTGSRYHPHFDLKRGDDTDSDMLLYTYTVTGGRIAGTGRNVTWDLSRANPRLDHNLGGENLKPGPNRQPGFERSTAIVPDDFLLGELFTVVSVGPTAERAFLEQSQTPSPATTAENDYLSRLKRLTQRDSPIVLQLSLPETGFRQDLLFWTSLFSLIGSLMTSIANIIFFWISEHRRKADEILLRLRNQQQAQEIQQLKIALEQAQLRIEGPCPGLIIVPS